MCFTKPKTPQPGAQPAPPAAAGADSLILGPTSNDDENLRNAGVLGRLALRVGRAFGTGPAKGPVGSGSGGGTGSVGSGSGGGSSSSGGGSSGGGSASGGGSSLGVGGGAQNAGGGGLGGVGGSVNRV